MGKIVNTAAPEGVALKDDFQVKVRSTGEEQWQTLSCYQVWVDMHEKRAASMACFDFSGKVEVEITCPHLYFIYRVDIRPLAAGIEAEYDSKTIRFTLDCPRKLSVEVNGERFHNLHLFAGALQEDIPDPESGSTLFLPGRQGGAALYRMDELLAALQAMPEGRTVYFGPGLHYLEECTMQIPSNTNVYLAAGAVLVGSLIVSREENIRIFGRGCLLLSNFERFTGLNAIRISHGKNIIIEGIHLLNPPHYSVYVGGSEKIRIENITSFSCEGWSDGIDIMSSRDVTVRDCFLRTSDDCIAVYGRRWDYNGDTRGIHVTGCTLWADVAHPTNIGTHGDYEHEGNILEDICFENLDILEHREHQAEYLGCMAINAGDKNTVRNVRYENIRIEPFVHGKILDIHVKRNPAYNPAPGRRIEHILLKDIDYMGQGEVRSCVRGYSEEYQVADVQIENLSIRGRKAQSLEEAGIDVGPFAENVWIC